MRRAGELPPLGDDFMAGVRDLYDRELRAQIQQLERRWADQPPFWAGERPCRTGLR